jgi:hypothetical protein
VRSVTGDSVYLFKQILVESLADLRVANRSMNAAKIIVEPENIVRIATFPESPAELFRASKVLKAKDGQ